MVRCRLALDDRYGRAPGATWRRACFGFRGRPRNSPSQEQSNAHLKLIKGTGSDWITVVSDVASAHRVVMRSVFWCAAFSQPGQLVRRFLSEATRYSTRYARHNRPLIAGPSRGESSDCHQSKDRTRRLKSRGRSSSQSIFQAHHLC